MAIATSGGSETFAEEVVIKVLNFCVFTTNGLLKKKIKFDETHLLLFTSNWLDHDAFSGTLSRKTMAAVPDSWSSMRRIFRCGDVPCR